jgi:hypothetical protein
METLKIKKKNLAYAMDLSEPETAEFSNKEELLQIGFVKCHLHQEGFYRFSICGGSYRYHVPLIAEYNRGAKYLVIGFIDGDLSTMDLPEYTTIKEMTKAT